MKIHFAGCATLAALSASFLAGQRQDTLSSSRLLSSADMPRARPWRHRSATNFFSTQAYPNFSVSGPAVITPNGTTNEKHLGTYFRLWLMQENLLTGNDSSDAHFIDARANNAPLIVDTAQAFVAGLLPAATLAVNTVTTPDPLFDPIDAGVARLDGRMAVAPVNGRLGGNALPPRIRRTSLRFRLPSRREIRPRPSPPVAGRASTNCET